MRTHQIPCGDYTVKVPVWLKSYRPSQVEAIADIVTLFEAGYQLVILQGPPGSGKTLIGDAVSQILGRLQLYVAPHKQLQDQVAADFADSHVLKGKSNYPAPAVAHMFPDQNCSHCVSDSLCGGKTCDYVRARQEARRRYVSGHLDPLIINCAYWIAVLQWTELLGEPVDPITRQPLADWIKPLTVVDECDSLEGTLMKALSVTLSERAQHESGVVSRPPKRDMDARWWQWFVDCRAGIGAAAKSYRDQVKNQGADASDSLLRNAQRMSRLHLACRLVDESWVYSVDRRSDTVTLKPVVPAETARRFLPKAAPMLLMSGTVLDPEQMARDVGLDELEWAFLEVDPGWDTSRAPIYRIPGVHVVKNRKRAPWTSLCDEGKPQKNWADVQNAVATVLTAYPDKRTLVCCGSYDLAHGLQSTLYETFEDRKLFTYMDSAGKERALNQYLKTPGAVMFAASMARGVDLPDDACEVIILAKVPWMNLGDRQVKARMAYQDPKTGSFTGKAWYELQALRECIQVFGRGWRHALDSCICFVIDEQFGRLWSRRPAFPSQFSARLQPIGALPPEMLLVQGKRFVDNDHMTWPKLHG